jgi:SAM-dependent methyltransferase
MEPMLSLTALRCVACGSPGLQSGADVLDCPNCDRSYPIVADVPVMFSDVVLGRGPLLAPAVVRTVLRAMDLPADTGNALRVRRASGARAFYGDRLVAAESSQFLRRVHASGYPIPAELLKRPIIATADLPAHAEPRCRWIIDYIPRAMRPGHAVLANVRFENSGDAPMRQSGAGRVNIAFAWTDQAGQAVPTEDYRTPLPLDLPPGQAITLPIRIFPPDEPGRYTLALRMVMEGVRWLEPDHGPLRITVRPDADFVPPPHWELNANVPTGYVADQERGIVLLREWLAQYGAPSRLRLLEIGGNAKPVLAHVPGESYNVDVDLLGLQVGAIVQQARQRSAQWSQAPIDPAGSAVGFVCADAHNLPFAEGFFDAIVMFASLHHVPQPAALLRSLRTHLRPGGFIGVFCEPIGHIWPGAVDEAFTEELEHGVNEQGFSLAEYAQIFAAAGLQAADLVADHNSLKARLVPVAEHG